MSKQDILQDLLDQGYTEEEAFKKIREDEEEQEQHAFFHFQEMHDRNKG